MVHFQLHFLSICVNCAENCLRCACGVNFVIGSFNILDANYVDLFNFLGA